MPMTPNPEEVGPKQVLNMKRIEDLKLQIDELVNSKKDDDKIEWVFDENQEWQSLEKTLNKWLEEALNKADKKTVKGLLDGVRKVSTDSSLNLDVDVKNDLKIILNILTWILDQKDSEWQKERAKEQPKQSFEKFLNIAKDSSVKKLNLNQNDFNNLVNYISDPLNVRDSIYLYKEMLLKEGRSVSGNALDLVSKIENVAGNQIFKLNGTSFEDFLVMLRDKNVSADDIVDGKFTVAWGKVDFFSALNFEDINEKEENWRKYVEMNNKRYYEVRDWESFNWEWYRKWSVNIDGFIDNYVFIGDFRWGKIDWEWTILHENWEKYTWSWRNELFDWKWTYFWNDWDKFVWERKNDEMWSGVVYNKDGNVKRRVENW